MCLTQEVLNVRLVAEATQPASAGLAALFGSICLSRVINLCSYIMSAPAKPASNWSKLKSKVSKPRTKQDDGEKVVEEFKAAKLSPKLKANYVGLDCEMVGIGPDGTQSALARCCLVDYDGEVIYDEFVRPPGYVTDFRTKWSGVRKKDLRQGTAISLLECQTAVANLLKDKVLVGHALRNDLDVLMLSHPRTMIRDTATFRPYMRVHGKHGKVRPRALKDLTKEHLHMEIQTGEHDPGVDARCAMFLYQHKREEWEAHLKDTKQAAKLRAATLMEENKVLAQAAEEERRAAAKLAKQGSTAFSREESEVLEAKRSAKETTLHTQEKVKKSKKGTLKDGGIGKNISMDVEVQVLGGSDDEDSQGSDNDSTDEAESALAAASIAMSGAKKRKISKNGMITSNSSKNHRTVDGRAESVKRAKVELEVRGGKVNATSTGIFGLAREVNGAGVKLKSIAEVDRAMKSALAKKQRA